MTQNKPKSILYLEIVKTTLESTRLLNKPEYYPMVMDHLIDLISSVLKEIKGEKRK